MTTIEQFVFMVMCEQRGLEFVDCAIDAIPDQEMKASLLQQINDCPRAELLGEIHERWSTRKKARGIFYTPARLVQHVVQHTLGAYLGDQPLCAAAPVRVLDPSCGSGAFLLGAFRWLLDWYGARNRAEGRGVSLSLAERQRILLNHVHGVDIDPDAAVIARHSLLLQLFDDPSLPEPPREKRFVFDQTLLALTDRIKVGNALIGPDFSKKGSFDWPSQFKSILDGGGFQVVIGNPPWGQKEIFDQAAVKQYMRRRYPSSAGIHDLFRPFVELGVNLTAPGGMFGMVLPDIVLLKNYPETRRFMLDQLTLTALDWWGMAFSAAQIDAATVIGRKEPAPAGHRVRVAIHDPKAPLQHDIVQDDFRLNPRCTFNLHLTEEKRHWLNQFERGPKLGDYFAIHEGIHSGNLRAELFLERPIDSTCRELIFGRDEIRPYSLRWRGKYVRLAALPRTRSRERYANLGRPEWHEREKVLVRRTGDHVLAAVDRESRFASNNFFLVFPTVPCALTLDGLCALLNSAWMTTYFRTIEPRQGRLFAELKIKHLRTFPLPVQVLTPGGCQTLNEQGARRYSAVGSEQRRLETRIERLVEQMFLGAGLSPAFE